MQKRDSLAELKKHTHEILKYRQSIKSDALKLSLVIPKQPQFLHLWPANAEYQKLIIVPTVIHTKNINKKKTLSNFCLFCITKLCSSQYKKKVIKYMINIEN